MKYKTIKLKKIDIPLFKKEIKANINQNLILDLLDFEISEKQILELYHFFLKNTNNSTSFVVINKNILIDNLPEELNIVPTFQEATDLIDLEEMMRNIN